MPKFGLVGRNISYSFSKTFFTDKFHKENRKDTYENFDVPTLENFSEIVKKNEGLKGINVTIPYKESIIPYLDKLHKKAAEIGAVNTIKIKSAGKLIGYNTDCYGFKKALLPYLPLQKKTALILGTGGASKAVAYVLDELHFEYKYVSRHKENGQYLYSELTKELIEAHLLIINCTPLGTYPKISEFPEIPYQYLTKNHLLFDLIYNPLETKFLRKGRENGTKTSNGLAMLKYQAEKSWEIWNS